MTNSRKIRLWIKNVIVPIAEYTDEQLYNLSQKIIRRDKNPFFAEAYNVSYNGIYDFRK